MEQKGFIFLCSDITEPECLERLLFGGQEKYVKRVKNLEKDDVVFLYNYNSKKLHGTFEAVTEVQENLVPEAWGGEFPWQVKVKRTGEHAPISREDIPREVLGFSMIGHPKARLDEKTLIALEKIFKSKKRIRTYNDSARYLAKDGHWVRSKAEQEIDNWLWEHRVVHGYETGVPGAKRCDFEIPTKEKSVYIEYWGLNNKKYLKDKEKKLEIYKKHKLNLIELAAKDLKNLDEILSEKVLPFV